MKHLTCEICGNNDIIKQNGIFVCQSCGCKYSREEVKNLAFIEGCSIKETNIDLAKRHIIKDLFSIAENSRSAADNENTQKYYEFILMLSPDNNEARFYSLYYKLLNLSVNDFGDILKEFAESLKFYVQTEVYENKNSYADLSDILINSSSLYKKLIERFSNRWDNAINFVIHSGLTMNTNEKLYNHKNVKYYNFKNADFLNSQAKLMYDTAKDEFKAVSAKLQGYYYIMRTSILDIYNILSASQITFKIPDAFKSFLDAGCTIFLNNINYMVHMDDHEKLIDDILAFDLIMKKNVIDYDGKIYTGTMNQALEIQSGKEKNDSSNTGTKILNILNYKEQQLLQKSIDEYHSQDHCVRQKLENDHQKLLYEKEKLNKEISKLEAKRDSIPTMAEWNDAEKELFDLKIKRASLPFFDLKTKYYLTKKISEQEEYMKNLKDTLDSQQAPANENLKSLVFKRDLLQIRINEIATKLSYPVIENNNK